MEINIVKTFGYITERAKNLSHYSSKLRESFTELDELLTEPIKKAGIDYTYPVVIHTERFEDFSVGYRLFFGKLDSYNGLYLKSYNECMGSKYYEFCDVKRVVLKKAAKHIPEALKAYCQKLEEISEEYKEGYEQINKICEAIKGIE